MADQPKCIPAALAFAETRAAAHELRALAARLLALAYLLPLPPPDELSALLEDATEATFEQAPILELHVDLDSLVRDELLPAAAALEEAANREGGPQ